jgi:purine-nucleoside phosphorylase
LRGEGFQPWLDEEDIIGGTNWKDAIAAAVRATDVVIVCLSGGSVVKDGFLQKEIRQIVDVAEEKVEGSIFIIPLKLTECETPPQLNQWQCINYFRDDGHSRLRIALNARARQVGAAVHAILPQSGAGAAVATDPSGFEAASIAAEFVRARIQHRPRLGLVLGSGLNEYADRLDGAVAIDYADIPHFPSTAAAVGRARRLVVGQRNGVPLAIMQGRFHMYEGLTAREVVFPIRVLARVGIAGLVLTNASGIVNERLPPGSIVVVSDHINLIGSSALTGLHDERFGPRFTDMTEVYSKHHRELTLAAARALDISVSDGIYVAHGGPAYETPAEIRSLKMLGADLVGMSTVPEAMAARHMGLSVLALSVATANAAGVGGPRDHAEVIERAFRVRRDFERLLDAVLPRIDAELTSLHRGSPT